MSTIKSFLERGILISPEIAKNHLLVDRLSELDDKQLEGVTVINKEFLLKHRLLSEEKGDTLVEKKNKEMIKGVEEREKSGFGSSVKVLFSYQKEPGKIGVNDFVAYFNRRFETLSSFLRQRNEFQRTISINRVKAKKERENIMLLGMVLDKRITKNNNIILTLEDPSGTINVLVSDKKKEVYNAAKEMVLDEVIGIDGLLAGNFVLANHIFNPDVPLIKELKKGVEEEYLVLLGDPHFGSKHFLKKEFNDFIDWINQKKGNEEQKRAASKIRYVVIIGDLVEGVGIYPDQEKDLEIKDIKEQYDLFTDYLKKIPSHIPIIVCPGNHDAGRISEPQPPLSHKYAQSLQELPNVILVSNPAFVNIGATKEFPGFDLLLYHGYSLIYYSNNVESIRIKGGQKRPDLIMKFLLQRRHLAPTHTSNLYVPDTKEDPLIIDRIPDFFITGHIHRVGVTNYKNITLINCSCWTEITEDQEKRGLQPQPAKIPLVNLKTREVKIINFLREEKPAVTNQLNKT